MKFSDDDFKYNSGGDWLRAGLACIVFLLFLGLCLANGLASQYILYP